MRLFLLGLFCAACLYGACHSPGTERWAIKISAPPGANLAKSKKTSLADLMKLPNPPGAKNKDPQFEKQRIPAFSNSLGVKEGDILTVTGYLYLVATEDNDCEYHIQISDQPRTAADKPAPTDECLIVEVARPEDFQDHELQKRAQAVRDFIKSRLLANKEPGPSGNVMQHTVSVQVTGELFYDNAHLKTDGTPELRGKRGMKSQTLWELHPVVDFQFAPKK